MLVLSLLFISLLLVLAYAISKDTGKNTKYARRDEQVGTRSVAVENASLRSQRSTFQAIGFMETSEHM